jgi:hypothetical protein
MAAAMPEPAEAAQLVPRDEAAKRVRFSNHSESTSNID